MCEQVIKSGCVKWHMVQGVWANVVGSVDEVYMHLYVRSVHVCVCGVHVCVWR